MVTVDTLKYLAMGGHIGKVQALLGWVLQFNPIVGIRDGETHPVDRPRTRRRAQRRIIELVRELAPIHQLHVSYSTGRDKALAIRDELADLVESVLSGPVDRDRTSHEGNDSSIPAHLAQLRTA